MSLKDECSQNTLVRKTTSSFTNVLFVRVLYSTYFQPSYFSNFLAVQLESGNFVGKGGGASRILYVGVSSYTICIKGRKNIPLARIYSILSWKFSRKIRR
jgi:hypothetical protein